MKDKIKNIAARLVRENGLINLSRRDLCDAAGISDGSFSAIMGVTFTEFVGELAAQNLEPLTLHPAVKARTAPALRKDHILRAAVDVARQPGAGYTRITRDAVAEAAGVSVGLVSHYFSTMKQLRRDIMRYAVQNEIAEIVAQGLAVKDDHARKASADLKRRAGAILSA